MTILLTGGLGKTTSRIASILASSHHSFLIASRSGSASPYPAVKFDWNEPSTWDAVFKSPSARDDPIRVVWLVLIGTPDPAAAVDGFMAKAKENGVRRVVFLSTTAATEEDGIWYGHVHALLKKSGLEWAVLRPSWFMQNFTEQQLTQPIKEESRVVSATGDGRVAFVNADDIAAVAVEALTTEKSFDTDLLVVGPEMLTYDDVANIMTDVLGRKVTHTRLTREEHEDYLKNKGLPGAVASLLSNLDDGIKKGSEENLGKGDVERVTGRRPSSFREFAEKEKGAW